MMSKICSYAQGMNLTCAKSNENGWDLKLGEPERRLHHLSQDPEFAKEIIDGGEELYALLSSLCPLVLLILTHTRAKGCQLIWCKLNETIYFTARTYERVLCGRVFPYQVVH